MAYTKPQIPTPSETAIMIAKIRQPIRLPQSEISPTYRAEWKSALAVLSRGPLGRSRVW